MNIFWKIIVLSISLLFSLSLRSQEIIRTEEGDSLVTITPHQLKIVNCIINDYEFLREKDEILKQEVDFLQQRNEKVDSLFKICKEEIEVKDEYWRYRVSDLQKQVKKEVRQKTVIGGVGGALVITLLAILIFR